MPGKELVHLPRISDVTVNICRGVRFNGTKFLIVSKKTFVDMESALNYIYSEEGQWLNASL